MAVRLDANVRHCRVILVRPEPGDDAAREPVGALPVHHLVRRALRDVRHEPVAFDGARGVAVAVRQRALRADAVGHPRRFQALDEELEGVEVVPQRVARGGRRGDRDVAPKLGHDVGVLPVIHEPSPILRRLVRPEFLLLLRDANFVGFHRRRLRGGGPSRIGFVDPEPRRALQELVLGALSLGEGIGERARWDGAAVGPRTGAAAEASGRRRGGRVSARVRAPSREGRHAIRPGLTDGFGRSTRAVRLAYSGRNERRRVACVVATAGGLFGEKAILEKAIHVGFGFNVGFKSKGTRRFDRERRSMKRV